MLSHYSIIIPIYNELNSLHLLLQYVEKYALQGHEIIIVDDGSNDGSDKILSKCKFIKLIRINLNKGKGNALKKGILAAKNKKIIIFDGDLELHPHQIEKLMLLDPDRNIRCVLANRLSMNYKSSIWDLGNKLITILFNFINRSKVKDSLCCAKAFLKSDIDIENLQSSKFDIDVEILSKLVKLKLQITDVNLHYKRRGKGQGKKLKFKDTARVIFRIFFS